MKIFSKPYLKYWILGVMIAGAVTAFFVYRSNQQKKNAEAEQRKSTDAESGFLATASAFSRLTRATSSQAQTSGFIASSISATRTTKGSRNNPNTSRRRGEWDASINSITGVLSGAYSRPRRYRPLVQEPGSKEVGLR